LTDPVERAAELFGRGYNCSQAVLAAFAPCLGLDEQTALRIAVPFGGGLSRRGQVCGAVSGALMVLGLSTSSAAPADKEAAYALGNEFFSRFEARHRFLACRDLLGHDLSTPDGRLAARRQGAYARTCPDLVRGAARILIELLDA
jgi:C_GCAxxG_C_C family probable redox protein